MTPGMFYNTFRYPAELLAAELMFLPLLKRKAYFVPGTMIFFVSYFSAAYYFRYQNVAGMFDRTWVGLVIRYMLLIIISFVWMYFSFELDLYRSCFNIISACAVQYASLCVHRLGTLAVYSFSVMQEYYIAVQIVMELLVYTLIYFLFYRFFVCKIRQEEEIAKNWDVLLLSSGILVNEFFLDFHTQHFNTVQIIYACVMPLFYCTSVLLFFVKNMENAGLRHDIRFITEMSKLKKEHYDALRQSILLTNMKCHDFKYQILQMRGQVQNEDREQILDELEQSIDVYDAIARTGNEPFDIVVTEKSMICQHKQIHFTYMADQQDLNMIDKQDIYVLFGNLLDNAIEAVSKIEQTEKRVINLSVHRKGQILYVEEYNYYEGKLRISNGMICTTKDNPSEHGYGLKSIKYIAEKYGGTVKVSCADQIFQLTVIMFLEKQKSS